MQHWHYAIGLHHRQYQYVAQEAQCSSDRSLTGMLKTTQQHKAKQSIWIAFLMGSTKLSMIICSILNYIYMCVCLYVTICSFFMVSFLYPKTELLYVASGVLGAGAALIWTGQGSYLSRCSNESNIARNSGVFWAMLQAR